MNSRSLRVVLALAISAAVGACSPRKEATVGSAAKATSIFLISIDTLRADRVGAYGSTEALTPNIDALAAQGIVFEEAYSHVPLTLPAHASLFTSLLPPRHGVRDNLGYTLAEKKTLGDLLKTAGFRTLGAVSSFVLRKGTGIAAGFDEYDDAIVTRTDAALGHQQRDGSETARLLADRIAATQGKVFAFLHLYEPHSPYTPPPKHAQHKAPYDGDVAYADEVVGQFIDRMKALGRFDDAVIVIAADHGEGLGDHGEAEHGMLLYREALHIPLVVKMPRGANSGRRVDSTVRQVDIAPTLLELADATAFETSDGQSLLPLIAATGAPRRAYAESFYGRLHMGWSEVFALTEGKSRFIRAPKPELYDLTNDPSEKKNLYAAGSTLTGQMDAWLVQQSSTTAFAQPGAVDAQTRENLQALGYLGASTPVVVKAGENLPNPKDHVASWSTFEKGLSLRRDGKTDEAIRVFQGVLKENPRMSDGWETLAQTLFRTGRAAEARRAFDRVIEFDPSRSSAHLSLAKLERLSGQVGRARQHAEIAARQDPGGAYEFLAELELSQGRIADAEAAATLSIAADPSRAMSHYALGVAAAGKGDLAGAESHFREAIKRSGSETGQVFVNLHSSLADTLARMGGRDAEAEAEFRKEIEGASASRAGRIGLSMLLRSQGRDNEARAAIAGLVEGNKAATAEDFEAIVRTLAGTGDEEAARQWKARARSRFPRDPRFR